MRRVRKFALGASLLASLAIAGSAGGGAIVVAQDQPTVRIASDNFYESELVAEIYAQALEAEGFGVERNLLFGSRAERAGAFEAGLIDLAPEYVGAGLAHYANDPDLEGLDALGPTGDGETNRDNLRVVYETLGIEASVLGITAGENTNAAVVRAETAEQYDLATMSDLAAVQAEIRFGFPPECEGAPLCRIALEEQYGIAWPPPQLESFFPCSAVMSDALATGVVDLAWLCSTQPSIAANGWVVLADDLDTQPAENLAPVVRNDFLEKVEGGAETIAAILGPISAALTTDLLTEMGVRLELDFEDVEVVAADFLGSLAG